MTTPTPTTDPFTPAELAALETFGNAWARLLHVEQAVASGEGVAFVHHGARQEMQCAAKDLRATLLAQGA
ncbi:hypothetical protein [Deinococcus sp.]|uniref:hypothetical protein n=1 Tax=Deinococcus sp. TaxID=47478 RepID=UPI0025C30C4A|nr:hypothetical protein [Deinococcus sp.]